MALLAGAGAARAAEPTGDGTDLALQQDMQRLYALRTVDPPAFVAQTRSLEALPPPVNLSQREFLRFLQANRAGFEGRFADAIALARPLSESAEDPKLRLMAATFVVNMRAGTREFESGLRELDRLLTMHPTADGVLGDEVVLLWHTAAIFYAELDKPELSAWYAERMLASDPTARQVCHGRHFTTRARQSARDATLTESDFDAADRACDDAGEAGILPGFLTLSRARYFRENKRIPSALTLLEERLGAIESTRYPRLVAEAYALDAELLLAANRVGAAERQARHALDVAKATPTSLPVAMAEKVLYEISRRRGESAAALGHLQRYVVANRALAEESRLKALAFHTVQHERMQREQALQLNTERHRVLDLEASVAKAESRNAFAIVLLVLLGVAGTGAWGWRLRRDALRFRTLARTDALTGFASRQHFTEQAQAALARGGRSGRPLMLVAFDLDHFKHVNDRHGHLAGDAVLRAVSQSIREKVGAPAPLIGRLGGEEFAVLLDGATPAQALAHAETLRSAIAAARATSDAGVELQVTASFGITGTHECGHQLQALLACSDRALYRAKNGGRDRVVVADRAVDLEAA